ncbi:MAG: TonB-dependent receptor, partial [Caulobacteraceae bacterium]|nr:TonB-dependent receptor [Caulobacteraceae bacterium]
KNAAGFGVDYQRPVMGVTVSGHLDGNYADGQYTSTTDPTVSDASFIMNGRVAVSDIRLGDTTGRMQLAFWVRNLADEQHAFLKNYNAALGTYGIFNEPRTFGVEARVKY